jgi:diguanylate cyclase (GGDEF)-like protein/PAS domain S-box-containing protein
VRVVREPTPTEAYTLEELAAGLRGRGDSSLDDVSWMHAQAVNASMDGIAILDRSERFVYVNPAHLQIYGYARAEELIGHGWRRLYSNRERERLEADVIPAFSAVGHWRGEAVGLRQDGTTFPQEVSLVAIEGGGMVCVVRDVTARKRTEALQEALRRIAEATGAAADSPSFYGALHAILADLAGARGLAVAVEDEALRTLSFPYFAEGAGGDATEPDPATRELFDRVLHDGLPLLAGAGFDWVGVPLKRGDRTFGVLAASRPANGCFSERERDLLHLVSSQVASAIERTRAAEALAGSEARFRLLAETAPCAIFIYQGERFVYVNEAGCTLTGYAREELLAKSFWDVVHPDMREMVWERGLARQQGVLLGSSYEMKIVRKDGEERWLAFSAGRTDFRGQPAALGAAIDITENKRATEQIRALAYHDPLTGLPNRSLFNDRLALAVAQARRSGDLLAVVFLDLDGFKRINDSLGHSRGDGVLKVAAQRIQASLRAVDTVARLGGDEFILLLPRIRRAEEAARVAEKVLDALRRPVVEQGEELFVTASLGLAVYPTDGDDPETLVKNADIAMYRAKEQGRNRYQLFAPDMNARVVERLAFENDLRRALARGELLVHYQPLQDLANGRLDGVEALLRWQEPSTGRVVPASEFIALAEATGLIVPIGPFVLRTACAQARAWQRSGHPRLRVSVNLSARQLQQPDLVSQVRATLEASALDPETLELEITEAQGPQGGEALRETLMQLKALGVRITIDDFGVAASSLQQLRLLPVDALKIDPAFVRSLLTSPEDAAIAGAVIRLAHTLGLAVIAEGVETEAQRSFLTAEGCDRIQGHLLSEPVSAEECARVLERFRDRT